MNNILLVQVSNCSVRSFELLLCFLSEHLLCLSSEPSQLNNPFPDDVQTEVSLSVIFLTCSSIQKVYRPTKDSFTSSTFIPFEDFASHQQHTYDTRIWLNLRKFQRDHFSRRAIITLLNVLQHLIDIKLVLGQSTTEHKDL